MTTNYTPRGTARERILYTAEQLFYNEGIRSVGIDRIIAESGVAKMTFYNHFKSKDELVAEYVRRRGQKQREWLEETLARHARPVYERPLAIFDALEERFTEPTYRGCGLINAIVEIANYEHVASQAACEQKVSLQDFISEILAEAGYEQSEVLAQQFMVLMDGAIVVSLREGTPAAAQVARHIAAQILAASAQMPQSTRNP